MILNRSANSRTWDQTIIFMKDFDIEIKFINYLVLSELRIIKIMIFHLKLFIQPSIYKAILHYLVIGQKCKLQHHIIGEMTRGMQGIGEMTSGMRMLQKTGMKQGIGEMTSGMQML